MGKEKVQINVVVMGHVNSGKSTTAGQLIRKLGGSDEGVMGRFEEEAYEPGVTDKDVMERFEMEAAEMKKSWKLVLGQLKADHERGITALWKFESNKYDFSVIDAASVHTRNMIPGTHLADCAVLIIDSTTAGFEQGISRNGGLTRKHPLHAYMFGIEQIICCCNKMDATTPKYSKGRYEEIVKQVSYILKNIGYNPDKIPFVPISSLEGDNVTERSTDLDWYKGPTLLEALDNTKKHKRPSDMPHFRRPYPKGLAADNKDPSGAKAAANIIQGCRRWTDCLWKPQ